MALTLETIDQALAQATQASQDSSWNPTRNLLRTRLQEVGLPRPRSDAFFWIPLSLLHSIDPSIASTGAPVATSLSPVTTLSPVTPPLVGSESDLASILPAMLCPQPELVSVANHTNWQTVTASSQGTYSYLVLQVPAGAKVRILLNSAALAFQNQRLDIWAGDHSEVEVLETSSEAHQSKLLRHAQVHLGKQATVRWLGLDCGKALYRCSVEAHLEGAEAQFEFRAISILSRQSHSHRRIRVWHKAPGVHSEQFIRHVLLEQSQASCDTQVEITKGTTGTKAHQLVNSLLLSEQAKASAKPTLIIHNDEVEASHGTTCGDLDANQLFYLRSRGLSVGEARRVLLSAFVDALVGAHPASEESATLANLARTTLTGRFA